MPARGPDGGLQQLQMPAREDLNLPEEGLPEPESAGAGAETPPQERTEQEVPEVEMAAAPEPLVAASKLPTDPVEEVVTLREATAGTNNDVNSAETNNHRSSTFLTEVEEQEDGAGPATTSLADIVAAVSEVESVGSIKDVEDKKVASDAKEPSPNPSKEASPAPPVKEASPPAEEKAASPQPEKETSPAPMKEESPAPTKESSPAPTKEASPQPEPVREVSPAPSKEETPAKAEEEPIGAVEDLKAEVNALLSTPDQQDAEDKKVIEEAKETIDETEAKEAEEGTVIDIQVIEEKKDDADVLDIVKAAEETFVAEVIPDNEEVDITPDEGEEVIEYTLNTADAIPIGAIAVATFAIFLALIFFYN